MSDPVAKKRNSKAKDARQMPAPDKVKPKRSKKKKPLVVEYKWKNPPFYFGWMSEWSSMGRYQKLEDAEKAMETQEKKHPDRYDMRVRGHHDSKNTDCI